MSRPGASASFAARPALAAIRCYQRWISPHKGFGCALRIATGAESCSTYGYRVIARFGLRRGFALLQRRLALCGHVHRSAPRAPSPLPAPWLRSQQGSCDVPCDAPDCGSPGCHAPHCNAPDWCKPDACDVCDCGCDVFDWLRKRRRQRYDERTSA